MKVFYSRVSTVDQNESRQMLNLDGDLIIYSLINVVVQFLFGIDPKVLKSKN